jgi:hypothetical protein
MIPPGILARMVERNDASGLGIYTGEIWPLVQVTSITGPSEVSRIIIASMLQSNNMLHMKCGIDSLLRQLAIFAAVFCSMPNPVAKGSIH